MLELKLAVLEVRNPDAVIASRFVTCPADLADLFRIGAGVIEIDGGRPARMAVDEDVPSRDRRIVVEVVQGDEVPDPLGMLLVGASLVLQVGLGLFFGHAYDMRIFLSTGYLVGTGQNPYLAQDLSAVFHNGSFQGITSIGYPPPWALVLGLIYLVTYRILPNFLLYNLAARLPVIAANIGLAYLTSHMLRSLGAQETTARKAW